MSDYTKVFHTVPLVGKELTRNSKGVKVGFAFPENGWMSFIENRNKNNTPLLAAIALDDFLGLDFDTDESFNTALKLDPECKYVAKSDLKGGHLLYKASDVELIRNKIPGVLDIQTKNKLIFLATPANKTKVLLTKPLTSLDELTTMPLQMQLYIENLILKYLNDNISYATSTNNKSMTIFEDSTLGYILKDIKPDSLYSKDIFKLITPQKYRPSMMHPNDIPEGEGTEYLQAIRTRLALDVSVSEGVFRDVMHYVNNQWSEPMTEDRINKDCDYQISKATINGQKAWVFDENWDKAGLIIKDKFHSAIEFFYDYKRGVFVEYNRTTKQIIVHATGTNAKHSIMAKKRGTITINDMISKSTEIELINQPTEPSYFTPPIPPYHAKFNTFVPAMGTQILRDPSLVTNPKYPDKILRFMVNLIPNKRRREWLLRFIRHKHLTYDYSPIYLVFSGVGGAGKGVFIDILLEFFAGRERIQDVDLEKLQNNFNAWKIVTDYVHIDEAGEGATKREAALVVAELKKLTGSAYTSVQYKGKDITGDDTQRQYITPILNTNIGVKVITDIPKNDRRFVFIKCPNKMTIISDNNDTEYVNMMREELPHFAHYLATQVTSMDIQEYTSNASQKDDDYLEFIEDTIEPIHLIIDAIENRDLNKFVLLLAEQYFIPLDKIDKLFDPRIQKNDEARVVLYTTPNIASLNLFSLYDMAIETGKMDAMEMKKLANKLKSTSTITDKGLNYKYNYLPFHGIYSPLKYKEVAPDTIDGAEEIEL